ncbi:MAG: hypothetical protein J6R27_02330 [Muribaculaceae bacterium]|nr:hypothetical protein [Muribaculaceae bacterium]
MWLTNSSIGRKFIMALTGAFLVLFVTFHVLMNGVALFWPSAYNVICEFLGANWYALIGTAVLAGGFVLHILYALWLTWENRGARGGDRYKVTSRPPHVEWSSKNMLVLGVVVICFLAVHMYQFWAKMQLVEVFGLPSEMAPAAGTWFIQQAFSCPWTVIIYLIGFAALWLHMTHGIWSMFQSSGMNNGTWMKRLKCIGNVWATAVCLLFAVEAVVFTVNAKNEAYTNCPELQQQYEEMMAAHHGDEAPACEMRACDKACDKACKAEGKCADCEGNCAEGKCADCEGNCAEGKCADCEGNCDDCEKPCKAEGKCGHHHEGCPAEEAPVENQVSEKLSNI